MKKKPVSLSELIESVPVELRTIRENTPAKGEEVLALTSCEIELAVAATTEGSAGIRETAPKLHGVVRRWCDKPV
jgi:Trypsin-co-occurring domain 2